MLSKVYDLHFLYMVTLSTGIIEELWNMKLLLNMYNYTTSEHLYQTDIDKQQKDIDKELSGSVVN